MSDQAPAGADFAALERELTGLLLKHDALYKTWLRAWGAKDRLRAARGINKIERRVVRIHTAIATAKARSLADVAVQLRRVSARLEGDDDLSRAMLASALAVVEAT